MRNIINRQWTNFNERTVTLLYKNIISHTLFSKGWWLLCVWEELETRTDCYIDPSLSEHSSTSSSSWLGLLNYGSLRAQALYLELVLTPLLSCLRLTRTACALVILLFNVYLFPPFFCLFTQVHLLIYGSVEGQYITNKFRSFLIALAWTDMQIVYVGNRYGKHTSSQDSNKYVSRFQQCCGVGSLKSSSDF